jgi:uncharacterized membrane protein YbhN (UPF0104 family)
MKSALRYIISLGLAGGLIWFVFKDIDLADMLSRFAQADWRWIALSCFLLLCAHVTRAWRWGMLMEPLGYKPGLLNSSISVLTGYFANYIVPRMGEVTRCGTLYRLEKIPVNLSFGTVVAERIFDVIILLGLIGLNFILEFERLSSFFTDIFQSKIQNNGSAGSGPSALLIVAGVVFLGLIVAAIVILRSDAIKNKLLQNPIVQKIAGFLKGMLEGLLSVRKLKKSGHVFPEYSDHLDLLLSGFLRFVFLYSGNLTAWITCRANVARCRLDWHDSTNTGWHRCIPLTGGQRDGFIRTYAKRRHNPGNLHSRNTDVVHAGGRCPGVSLCFDPE